MSIEHQTEHVEAIDDSLDISELAKQHRGALAELDDNALQAYEQRLVEAMQQAGIPGRTLEEFLTRAPDVLQRRAQRPADRRLMRLAQVEELQAAVLRAQRERHELASKQAVKDTAAVDEFLSSISSEEGPTRVEEKNSPFHSLMIEADKRANDQYHDWTASRMPYDRYGRPALYSDNDKQKMNLIEAQRKGQSIEAQEFAELTNQLEAVFGRGLHALGTFGSAETFVEPSSKIDDINNRVDMVAGLNIPVGDGETRHINLGIDFTITSRERDQANKIFFNRTKPIRRLNYGTEHTKAGDFFLPVVLSIDKPRAERLRYAFGLSDVPDSGTPTSTLVRDRFRTEVANHRDGDVFRYTVLEQAVVQLELQRDDAEAIGLPAEHLSAYDATIEYLRRVLEERKNLADVNQVVQQSAGRKAFRVGDPGFLQRVPTIAQKGARG